MSFKEYFCDIVTSILLNIYVKIFIINCKMFWFINLFPFLFKSTEPQIFKSKFYGWDDVIAVDFTRTAQSVARTGADLKVTLRLYNFQCLL